MAHSQPASQAGLKAGGLAQLVERLLCKQDVSGSSPLTSIQRKLPGSEDKGVAAVVTDVLREFSLQAF